ncbi:hypothetical protein AB0I68_06895 [Streptomyces sp. NPDC050448]
MRIVVVEQRPAEPDPAVPKALGDPAESTPERIDDADGGRVETCP